MDGPSEAQTLPTCEPSTFGPSEEQALTTFNRAADELCFLRGHQWRVTYYALIAYAALAAAPLWVEPGSWRNTVSVLALMIVVLAAVETFRQLLNNEVLLNVHRQRLRAAQDNLLLMREIHKAYSIRNRSDMWWRRRYWKKRVHEQGTDRGPRVKIGLIAVVFLGWIVATLIILSRIPSVQRVVAWLFGWPFAPSAPWLSLS